MRSPKAAMATSRFRRTRALDPYASLGRRGLYGVFFLARRSRRRSLSLLEPGPCVRALLGAFLLQVRVGVGVHVSRSRLDLLLGAFSLFHSNSPSVRACRRRPYPLVVEENHRDRPFPRGSTARQAPHCSARKRAARRIGLERVGRSDARCAGVFPPPFTYSGNGRRRITCSSPQRDRVRNALCEIPASGRRLK